jgi:hypothetical protein
MLIAESLSRRLTQYLRRTNVSAGLSAQNRCYRPKPEVQPREMSAQKPTVRETRRAFVANADSIRQHRRTVYRGKITDRARRDQQRLALRESRVQWVLWGAAQY